MDYFIAEQDKRFLYAPDIDAFHNSYKFSDFSKDNASNLEETYVFFSMNTHELDQMDFVLFPICLVNKKVRDILEIYDQTLVFKTVFILNNQTNDHYLYFAPLFEERNCISSDFIGIGSHNKIVLIKKEITNSCIFRASSKEREHKLIIRLDLAESLLRRGVCGIQLKRVEVTE